MHCVFTSSVACCVTIKSFILFLSEMQWMGAAQEPQYMTSFLKNSQSHLVLLNVNRILTSTLLIFIFQFLFLFKWLVFLCNGGFEFSFSSV